MTSCHGRRGQVPNEEVPYHEHSIQDMMIEDLQRQVVELTQRLTVQNLEIYCDINCHNSDSNFENLYHKLVLVQEHRVWNELHEDLGFRVEIPKIYDWVPPLIYNIYLDEDDLLKEISFMVNTENFIEENNSYDVFDESPRFEGFNLEVEEISLVDFLRVDNILSNSLGDGGLISFMW